MNTSKNTRSAKQWVQTKALSHLMQRADLFRLVRDVVADILSRMRREDVFSLGVAAWSENSSLKDTGLALGSMERVAVAQGLTDFFQLRDHGYEDYLLSAQTIDDWLKLITLSLEHTGQNLAFRTSGSTSEPKLILHQVAHLKREVNAWPRILAERSKAPISRIISLVPAHHIYGCLWSVLLPAALDVPIVDKRLMLPQSALRDVQPGDMVLAVPSQWQAFAEIKADFTGILGINAAGPLQDALWAKLAAAGLRLCDVYGSTETGAIGYRWQADTAYKLMPFWRLAGDRQSILPAEFDELAEPEAIVLPDHIAASDDGRHITIVGRRDGAVSINGVNVDPALVRDVFLSVEGVTDCAVRPDPERQCLKMFVATELGRQAIAPLRTAIRNRAVDTLPSAARPAIITFGKQLPRNDMGKLIDWVGEPTA